MKIAFYGDSFVASESVVRSNGWPNILARKFRAESTTNFSRSASSLAYSYYKFLKNYKNYDLNIFVVTHMNRFGFFEQNKSKEIEHSWCGRAVAEWKHIESINQHHNFKLADEKIFNNKKLELAEYPYNNYYSNLAMIDSVKYLDKNALVIHAFNDYSKSNLKNLQALDYIYHKKDPKNSGEENLKLRPCHISIVQNEELAEYIFNSLQGKNNIETILHEDNVSKYFTITTDYLKTGIEKGEE